MTNSPVFCATAVTNATNPTVTRRGPIDRLSIGRVSSRTAETNHSVAAPSVLSETKVDVMFTGSVWTLSTGVLRTLCGASSCQIRYNTQPQRFISANSSLLRGAAWWRLVSAWPNRSWLDCPSQPRTQRRFNKKKPDSRKDSCCSLLDKTENAEYLTDQSFVRCSWARLQPSLHPQLLARLHEMECLQSWCTCLIS